MNNDVNELQESEDYFTEQSHTSEESWSAAVVAALEEVASYDPRGPQDVLLPEKKYLYCKKTNTWRDVSEYREPLPPEPPDELSAFTALKRPGDLIYCNNRGSISSSFNLNQIYSFLTFYFEHNLY